MEQPEDPTLLTAQSWSICKLQWRWTRHPSGPNWVPRLPVAVVKLTWRYRYTRVYPKVSGLAGWSKNCKWYSFLPLDAVVSLFCVSLMNFAAITLCVSSQRVFIVAVYLVIDSVRKHLDTPPYLVVHMLLQNTKWRAVVSINITGWRSYAFCSLHRSLRWTEVAQSV
jgi:hypothetical protein